MPDIVHRIGIKASAAKVFAAVSSAEGVAGWWTTETRATAPNGAKKHGPTTDGLSMESVFSAKSGAELGRMTFDVTTPKRDEEVRWHFTDGPAEWLGTEVTFTLSRDEERDMTVVLFGHRDWREQVEFMAHCSMKWAVFLQSLRQLAETGKGQPSPDDVKIDNWN